MKIWLDDIRPMPAEYDTHVKTAAEAISQLKSGFDIEMISFDHDLGEPENGTGYDVAKYIETMAHCGEIKRIPEWTIHSANPVGKQHIDMAMRGAERGWEANERSARWE